MALRYAFPRDLEVNDHGSSLYQVGAVHRSRTGRSCPRRIKRALRLRSSKCFPISAPKAAWAFAEGEMRSGSWWYWK